MTANMFRPRPDRASIAFDIDEKDRPSAMRQLGVQPAGDAYVDGLAPFEGAIGSRIAIGLIRAYRHYAPLVVRNRCVFEPSCSRYAELAIRDYGLVRALPLCLSRLRRCRADNGGMDLTGLEGTHAICCEKHR